MVKSEEILQERIKSVSGDEVRIYSDSVGEYINKISLEAKVRNKVILSSAIFNTLEDIIKGTVSPEEFEVISRHGKVQTPGDTPNKNGINQHQWEHMGT